MRKKYIKLVGHEKPTPESDALANEFMEWYGDHLNELRRYIQGSGVQPDDDVMTDTMLRIHEAIALKGLAPNGFTAYYLTAYRNNHRQAAARRVRVSYELSLDMADSADEEVEARESIAARVEEEIVAYVRANYDEVAAALFEIYLALQPGFSYAKMAQMLGFRVYQIWPALGAIRRDVAARFADRGEELRTVWD